MPTIYKRNGSEYWYTRGTDKHGEWKESCRTKNRRDAEKEAKRIHKRRLLEDERPYSLAEAFEELRMRKVRANRSAATMDKLATKGGHVLRIFGLNTNIHTITLADCERYIDQRRSEFVGTHTIKMELDHLKQALRTVKRHGLYDRDPDDIYPKDALENAYIPRDRYLTVEEAKVLAEALPESRRDLFWFYIYTGARKSEPFKVYARHVRDGEVRIEGTKTDHSARNVSLHPDIRPMVERRAAMAAGGPIFKDQWDATQGLMKACRRIGMEHCSPNDLRRTFATWLAQNGANQMAVSKMMGHSSVTMLKRVYAQFGKDSLSRNIALMPSINCSEIGPGDEHIPETKNTKHEENG